MTDVKIKWLNRKTIFQMLGMYNFEDGLFIRLRDLSNVELMTRYLEIYTAPTVSAEELLIAFLLRGYKRNIIDFFNGTHGMRAIPREYENELLRVTRQVVKPKRRWDSETIIYHRDIKEIDEVLRIIGI